MSTAAYYPISQPVKHEIQANIGGFVGCLTCVGMYLLTELSKIWAFLSRDDTAKAMTSIAGMMTALAAIITITITIHNAWKRRHHKHNERHPDHK